MGRLPVDLDDQTSVAAVEIHAADPMVRTPQIDLTMPCPDTHRAHEILEPTLEFARGWDVETLALFEEHAKDLSPPPAASLDIVENSDELGVRDTTLGDGGIHRSGHPADRDDRRELQENPSERAHRDVIDQRAMRVRHAVGAVDPKFGVELRAATSRKCDFDRFGVEARKFMKPRRRPMGNYRTAVHAKNRTHESTLGARWRTKEPKDTAPVALPTSGAHTM